MQDFDVQADQAIVITTSDFNDEAKDFANRNHIELLTGYEFYHEIENLRENGTSLVLNVSEMEL